LRRWFTVAVIAFGILIGPVILEPGEALAYVGPSMKVISNSPGFTGYQNRDLNYAVDDSPSTCATIGTYEAEAAWQFADDQPRWVTGVQLTIQKSNVQSAQVFGPDGTFEVADKYPEPRLMLGFRIQNGNSGFITSLCDVQITFASVEPPGSPQNLRVLELEHDRVAVAWDAPADGGTASGYRVYRDGEQIAETTATQYVDETVHVGAQYVYEVAAFNTYGESERAGPLAVTVPVPEPPGTVLNLRPVTVDAGGVTLAWEPPAAGGPVTQYQVLRDGQLIAETGDTTYTDELVEPLAQYMYAVQAVGPGGTGPAETVAVSVPELPTEPPGAVQSLRARVGARTVELVWSRPETGGRPREYRVYRDDSLWGTTPETSWRDTTGEPESEYVYAVVPVNEVGPGETTTLVVRTPSAGLLDGAGPGVSGLGPQVGAGLGMLLPPFLVAAGLLLARLIVDRGMGWLGGWRRV